MEELCKQLVASMKQACEAAKKMEGIDPTSDPYMILQDALSEAMMDADIDTEDDEDDEDEDEDEEDE
jgi:hypothetical protein